ncbi:stage II sporulation protein M [Proteiniphilum acetatigenes]|uniref:stage II sporulation protein M n=1 Tax=Proteiniphilum acetatigenes TaxID=294710 RepID=UPI00037EA693|nr:stage II sporulation protein M [Proteiniphilum acetatigenes]
MKEVAFIKQNKSKWLEFEQLLASNHPQNPDEMANLYIHLLNDLSFAQTYYPKSKTTDYLNFLVSQIYRKIYKTKRLEKNRFWKFFKTDVPLTLYKYRKTMWFAFAMFLFFIILGAVSARYDDTFVRMILGDGYVNMTLENIEKGDPMAVYKSGGRMGSFIGITVNNVYVALRAFIFGVLAGIPTFYIAMTNGIMVGSFQYFFYEHGVFVESLQGIWLHGAMEIFSIIVATASGFILAASVLFPGTYSRFNSFRSGFKESLYIIVSTVPFFVAAGFIEGFVTRLSDSMSLWLNLVIILGSFLFIFFYYMVYPFIVAKKSEKGKELSHYIQSIN